jgi:lipopolysaccharide transport system ATP-binding protein
MKKLAIKAEHISKQYRLGQIGTGTLSHDLNRLWHKLRGQPDPYLKIGEQNDRSKKGESEYVWSLKDINFEIEQGDAVGIIGRNGAGKSTLLKILSKVTQPTTGSIKVNGRIASLLEVGTGFHPEMTGRENIYMNGAILGMRKKEIDRKLDEIIDFSGVERYIDTPVKRYSSGMYVRLAFAVAAHLESEILIVDEVLAVGDAEFQKKCLGKMGEVSKGEGRTVLFVSHNMAAVQTLCEKSIFLAKGEIIYSGDIYLGIDYYLKSQNKVINEISNIDGKRGVKLINWKVYGNTISGEINNYSNCIIELHLMFELDMPELVIGFNVLSSFGYPIIRQNYNDYNTLQGIDKGEYIILFEIPAHVLAVGNYILKLDVAIPYVEKLLDEFELQFSILPFGQLGNKFNSINSPNYNSTIRANWLKDMKKIK